MSRTFIIAFSGLLLAINAFSCDITLPAFWSLARDLGEPVEAVQQIIPTFLFFSAFGQLVFGPASDKWGRRPVILIGIATYVAGALVGFMATSLSLVLAGRALQGFGSACCVVVARAVMRDTHQGMALAQAMAMATAIIAIGPILAPLLGVGLVAVGEWRGVFAGMAVFGLGLMTAGLLKLRETNAAPDPTALRPRRLVASLAAVMGHPQSRYFVLLAGINSFLILSFVTNAPRLFKSEFGIEGVLFPVVFGINGVAIIVGQIMNSRAITRYGALNATRAAALAMAMTAGGIAALAAMGHLALPAFLALMFIFSLAFPIVMSNAAAMVIDPHPAISGLASSVFGFMSQLVSAVLVFLTVPLIKGAMLPWALVMTLVAAIVAVALFAYRGGR